MTLLALLAMLSLPTPAPAARASKTPGIDAFERGDYMNAFKLLSPKAKAGDAEAQYRLGIIRDEGGGCKKNYIAIRRRIQRGCPPDHQKALEWLRLAAEQDHVKAQIELGRLFLEGRDEEIPSSVEDAYLWITRAAAQNDGEALFILATFHEEGTGTPPDRGAAIETYLKSALAGYAFASDAIDRLGGTAPSAQATPTPQSPAPPQVAKTAPVPPATPPIGPAPATRPAPAPAPVVASVSFGDYYALVIGNDAYPSLPQLHTAVADAKSVHELLETRYGFDVETLLNASRSEIVSALARYRRKLETTDNLLIYYAGHGWNDKEANQGYWLPIDSRNDEETNWISNGTITSMIRAMPAKHVMVVADSCFSGTLTRGINVKVKSRDYIRRLAERRARTALTSGGIEPVEDGSGGRHSVFANAFLNALENNKGVLDATTLYSMIRRPVMLESDQTPQYGDIRRAGHQDGDFLFVRTR